MVCVHQQQVLMIRLEDPASHVTEFYFPGGMIEPNELPIQTAEREALEETGYMIKAQPKSEYVNEYVFHWGGHDYDCKTFWYLGDLTTHSPREVADADYHRGVIWVPVDEVRQKIAFHASILAAFDILMSRM